ncbi:MAG: hypothetical protein ABI539_13385 [Acidobacteriota bacterium]
MKKESPKDQEIKDRTYCEARIEFFDCQPMALLSRCLVDVTFVRRRRRVTVARRSVLVEKPRSLVPYPINGVEGIGIGVSGETAIVISR